MYGELYLHFYKDVQSSSVCTVNLIPRPVQMGLRTRLCVRELYLHFYKDIQSSTVCTVNLIPRPVRMGLGMRLCVRELYLHFYKDIWGIPIQCKLTVQIRNRLITH